MAIFVFRYGTVSCFQNNFKERKKSLKNTAKQVYCLSMKSLKYLFTLLLFFAVVPLFAQQDNPAEGADNRAGKHGEYGQRHEHSGALQPAGVGELLDTVYLVRVLVFGDEEVDEGDKRGAGKEGGQHADVGHARAHLLAQHAQCLGHQLHERDVDHDSGRESEGGREKLGVGALGKKGDEAPHAGR